MIVYISWLVLGATDFACLRCLFIRVVTYFQLVYCDIFVRNLAFYLCMRTGQRVTGNNLLDFGCFRATLAHNTSI
jgi:hypothetical protein